METREISEKLEKIEELINRQTLQNKTIFTIAELIIYTGFSKHYIYKLTSQKKIPFSKPNGKNIFFKKSDVDNFFLSNPQATIDEIEEEAINYVVNELKSSI